MSAVRPGSAGATRTCPHCKATVLLSANICPACQHHLRFSYGGVAEPEQARISALNVEGTISVPSAQGPSEYCVVVAVHNSRGEKIARQVISVGVLQPGDPHKVQFSVELMPVRSGTPRGR